MALIPLGHTCSTEFHSDETCLEQIKDFEEQTIPQIFDEYQCEESEESRTLLFGSCQCNGFNTLNTITVYHIKCNGTLKK